MSYLSLTVPTRNKGQDVELVEFRMLQDTRVMNKMTGDVVVQQKTMFTVTSSLRFCHFEKNMWYHRDVRETVGIQVCRVVNFDVKLR